MTDYTPEEDDMTNYMPQKQLKAEILGWIAALHSADWGTPPPPPQQDGYSLLAEVYDASKEDVMTDQTYYTAIPREYHTIGGGHLPETACGHAHRSIRTAEQCSRTRNPSRAPGTERVDVYRTDGTLVAAGLRYDAEEEDNRD